MECYNNSDTTLRPSSNIQVTNKDEPSKSLLAYWGSRQISTANSKCVHMNALIKRKNKKYYFIIVITVIVIIIKMLASE